MSPLFNVGNVPEKETIMSEVNLKRKSGGLPYRSPMLPILLIGVGLIWLLSNLGISILPWERIVFVLQLWPLILIVIGLDMLFGRNNPRIGALIGLGALVLVVVLMALAPSLGLVEPFELQQQALAEPLEAAESAAVSVALGSGQADIGALEDGSELLFTGDISYYGELNYRVSGSTQREIALGTQGPDQPWYGWMFPAGEQQNWEIFLNPGVPLDLKLVNSSGHITADLSSMQLTALETINSSGDVELRLPSTETAYDLSLLVSSGSITVEVPEGAFISAGRFNTSSGQLDLTAGPGVALTAEILVSSGSSSFSFAAGAPVRLEVVQLSSGSVNVPSDWSLVSGEAGRSGSVYESPAYANAENPVLLRVSVSSGSVTVR